MDWAKTTTRGDNTRLVLGFGATCTRGFTVILDLNLWHQEAKNLMDIR